MWNLKSMLEGLLGSVIANSETETKAVTKYNEMLADDFDANILPLIKDLTKNNLSPVQGLLKYLPNLVTRLGGFGIGFNAENKRSVLQHLLYWYRIKGTKYAYEVMLERYGITIDAFTENFDTYRFDSSVTLDDTNRTFDLNCPPCSTYSLELSSTDNNGYLSIEAYNYILAVIQFNEPINANLAGLIYNGFSILNGYANQVTQWATLSMQQYMLIHHLDPQTGATITGREFDSGFKSYIVSTLETIASELDVNGLRMDLRPPNFMAKSFYAFHTTETTWTIWSQSQATFSGVDLGWEWNGQILLDKLVPRALSGRFGLCWDRHGNAISLGGHFPSLTSIETARNNYNEKPFRGTLPKIKYSNHPNFNLVRLHRTGQFSGRYEDNASANIKAYYLRGNKLNYIPFYVIDRVRLYFYVHSNSLSYEAMKLIIETLHDNLALLISDGTGVLNLVGNLGNVDVINDLPLMDKVNDLNNVANWNTSL